MRGNVLSSPARIQGDAFTAVGSERPALHAAALQLGVRADHIAAECYGDHLLILIDGDTDHEGQQPAGIQCGSYVVVNL
jgi:hypothetical protein